MYSGLNHKRHQLYKHQQQHQVKKYSYLYSYLFIVHFWGQKGNLKLVPHTCFFLSYCEDFRVKSLILMLNQHLSTHELGLIWMGFKVAKNHGY